MYFLINVSIKCDDVALEMLIVQSRHLHLTSSCLSLSCSLLIPTLCTIAAGIMSLGGMIVLQLTLYFCSCLLNILTILISCDNLQG